MKKLSFRIRREYFDAIVRGDKTVEYRPDSEFWRRRFGIKTPIEHRWPEMAIAQAWRQNGPIVAVFICGKRVHRRAVMRVKYERTPAAHFSAQGRQDVPTDNCFAIYLGGEVKGALE